MVVLGIGIGWIGGDGNGETVSDKHVCVCRWHCFIVCQRLVLSEAHDTMFL